jgi:hypothetical protein
VNKLTAITDSTEARYACVVTCDGNNNITQLDESMTGVGAVPPPQTNHLYSIFEYDDLNRLTKHKTKAWVAGGTNNWVWVERQHEYSGVGALVRSGWRTYTDGTTPPSYNRSEHSYDQQTGHFIQNTQTSGAPPARGTRWVWAGAQNGGYGNLFGPNSDTASQNAYTLSAAGGAGIPNRRTFINPSTEGDKRELWGQGRPMGKDSNTAWSTGTVSQAANTHMNPVVSRLAFEGTVSSTDYSRITDMREKGRIGIFGTGFSYAGSSGRVTSESLGRDLNPLGRGDGMAYVGGGQNVGVSAGNLGKISPRLPDAAVNSGSGNSINNGCSNCPVGVPPPSGNPPGGSPPPPQQPPTNPPGDQPPSMGPPDGHEIVSPDGLHAMNLNCYLAWKASWNDDPLGYQYCRPCIMLTLSRCGYPTAGDWVLTPEQALQDYCTCNLAGNDCVYGTTPHGTSCAPPLGCIDCGKYAGSPNACPCKAQDVLNAQKVFKQDIDKFRAYWLAMVAACAGVPPPFDVACMLAASAYWKSNQNEAARNAQNWLASTCGCSVNDTCKCLTGTAGLGFC